LRPADGRAAWTLIMANTDPPLSSTVSSVFAAFLKKLEDEKTISPEAISALREALDEQNLDPESLRAALFPNDEDEHDPD
jgi:hypothetical protein